MQTIETGYKPEFGLGAYFAGQNAANVEDFNQEELIKSFLANQQTRQKYDQDTQMNPLLIAEQKNKNTVGDFEAAYADKKRLDPNYMDANIKGQIGQMQGQEAAGKFAKDMLDKKIELQKLVDAGVISQTQFDNLIKAARLKEAQGGSIGFPTTQDSIPVDAGMGATPTMQMPVTDPTVQTPNLTNQDFMLEQRASMLANELMAATDPKEKLRLQGELRMLGNSNRRGKGDPAPIASATGTIPVFSNMVTPTTAEPVSNDYNRLMNLGADTIEQRQKLQLAKLREDSDKEQAQIRATAVASHQAAVKSPKYKEILANEMQIKSGTIPATPQRRQQAIEFIEMDNTAKMYGNPAAYQPTPTIADLKAGDYTGKSPIERATGKTKSGNKFTIKKD